MGFITFGSKITWVEWRGVRQSCPQTLYWSLLVKYLQQKLETIRSYNGNRKLFQQLFQTGVQDILLGAQIGLSMVTASIFLEMLATK